jgi:23S rRNA A2030 N6-methylase RlmJ
MPKIINTVEFKNNLKRHTTDIVGYYLVANENSKNKSFVVMDTEIAIGLFIESGHAQVAAEIDNALKQVNQKVSDKYRKIRSIR